MSRSRSSTPGNDVGSGNGRRRLSRRGPSDRDRALRLDRGLFCSTSRLPQRCPRGGANIRRGTPEVLARARRGLDVRDRATGNRGVGERQRRLGPRRCSLRRFALPALLGALAVALPGGSSGARHASSSNRRVTFPHAGPGDESARSRAE